MTIFSSFCNHHHHFVKFVSSSPQIHREFRKPLIVIAPKNLLRHKECKSNLSEFDDVQGHPGFDKQDTRFKRLIKDQNDYSVLEEGIRRLVLCSGKVCCLLSIVLFFFFCFCNFFPNRFLAVTIQTKCIRCSLNST